MRGVIDHVRAVCGQRNNSQHFKKVLKVLIKFNYKIGADSRKGSFSRVVTLVPLGGVGQR